jgi:hypothetical protein
MMKIIGIQGLRAPIGAFRHGKRSFVGLGASLVATSLACAALVTTASPASAASTTVTITSSTPTTVVTLNKGETVNLTIVLTTTDPDESGEGEPFTISYGRNTTTYSEYGIPDLVPITAATNGETVSASIQGGDGDESAAVTINTNPNPLAQAPTPVKQWATKVGVGTGILSGGFWVCAELAPFFTAPTAALKAVCGISAAAFSLATAVAAGVALDPADPNYKVFAEPRALPVPSLSSVPFPEKTPLFRLVANLQTQRAFGQAAITSFNRAAGAVNAGNTSWATKQHQLGLFYIHLMGVAMVQEPGLLSAFVQSVRAGGIPEITVTPDQVLSIETAISQNGIPADIAGHLTELGASSADTAQVQQIILSRNVNDVAGSYFNKLIDPAFIATLRSAARAFLTAS